MYFYEVIPTKIFRQDSNILTYEYSKILDRGTIVLIPLGKKAISGLVLKKVTKPDFPTKPIEKILYTEPLPHHLVESLLWLHEYYSCALPTVLQSALPRGIEKSRRLKQKISKTTNISTKIPLSPVQTDAISFIQKTDKNTILLHGVTGSGKTNIYLKLAQETLKSQRSVILLVPEIALTSQLVQNFQHYFENITLLHSKQTEAERHVYWEKILVDKSPQIVIGPRSALFAPIKDLGLIIVDEAHEPAYYQDQSPKYSATKLASAMASFINKPVSQKAVAVLGTATPNISDYYLAKSQNALISINELAIKTDKTTQISIIDLKNRTHFKKNRLFSDELLTSIQDSLSSKTQSMIFHNRRGSAPLTICDRCGWQALCPHCLLPLNLHNDKFKLICHTCGYQGSVMTNCPHCHNSSIIHKGFGTKHIEQELTKLFPNAKISRFDADTEADKALQNSYSDIINQKTDIIIGTQMIAKGFDFPHLTTLGIVQADAGLSLPDFSSEERTFQLLAQVIGRANRGHQNTKIFIQTYQPEHPTIIHGATSDYSNFYNTLIKSRKSSSLPPFVFLLKISLTYKTERATIRNIQNLRANIQKTIPNPSKTWTISPPMPSFHEHTPKGYTWQLVIKSKKRKLLSDIIKCIPKDPHLHVHLDPPSLL